MLPDVAKLLIGVGVLLAVGGGVLLLATKAGFRGLPGDVTYRSGDVRVYLPVVTCLLLSLAASGVLWVWNWWAGR